MSTTARKTRKRNRQLALKVGLIADPDALRFQHPVKVATPLNKRASLQAHSIPSESNSMREAHYGWSKRQLRKLGVIGGSQPRVAPAEDKIVEPNELDPKPFRIGRKRYALAEAANIVDLDGSLVFSPRKGYEANRALYPALLG